MCVRMVRQVGESGNDALSAGDAPTDDSFRVDKFVATAHRISLADRALLHELTVGVFWPHRWRDLDVFISLGEGYLAVDEIGRAMGSAMCFRAEPDFAMLGMMVTAPRLQTMGTGRWLLRRVMNLTTEPGDLVLDCFVGSGTTAKVAVELGRRYLGIDRTPEYVEMACSARSPARPKAPRWARTSRSVEMPMAPASVIRLSWMS